MKFSLDSCAAVDVVLLAISTENGKKIDTGRKNEREKSSEKWQNSSFFSVSPFRELM